MSNSAIKKYAEDEIIIREGDSNDVIFKVISGSAAIYLNYGKENEYLVGILSDKRYFGEEGFLSGKPAIFTAVATEETHVMCIGLHEFEDYLQNNFQNVLDIMRDMTEKMMTLKANLNLLDKELIGKIQRETFKQKSREMVLNRYKALSASAVYSSRIDR